MRSINRKKELKGFAPVGHPEGANGRRHLAKCDESAQTAADIQQDARTASKPPQTCAPAGPRERGPLEVEGPSTNSTTRDTNL